MEKKNIGKPILFIILLAVFVLLIHPEWIPFLNEETKEVMSQALSGAYGFASDIEGSANTTLARILCVISIVLLMNMLIMIYKFIISKIKIKSSRTETILELVKSMIKYLTYLITLVWCLGVLGVNVAGILAGIGILGLVVGFGAQSLIEDIITGIFIIFEGQYSIGDVIVLDDFRGTVKKIGVRTTSIVDEGGNLKVVNNSDIRNFQNRSHAPSVAVCDIALAYSASLEKAETSIKNALPKIQAEHSDIFQRLEYKGVEALTDNSLKLRVVAYTDEANIFDAKRLLNREIKLVFDEAGIIIPLRQLVVHQAE